MTPLKTENLELTLEDNIVHLTVTGPIAKESMDAGLEWIGHLQEGLEEANDNYALRVDMPEDEFSGLGQMSQQFKRVGTVLRHSTLADKCAIMTDSSFVRNSARIEGSVIPGMDVRSFDLDETTPATRWLKGQPLIQAEEVEITESVSDEKVSDNAWDNLNVKKLSL
jgi:hypothetical protein